MKKKHRPTLVFGWLAFLSGDLLTLLAVYLDRGTCPFPDVADCWLSTLSLTSDAPSSYALGIFLIIIGFVILLTRRKKRATLFFSLPFLTLCYLTLYAFYHLDPANPVPLTVFPDFPVHKRTLVFVLFILELFLYVAVVIAIRPIDARLRKRAEHKQKLLEAREAEMAEKERLEQLRLEEEAKRLREERQMEMDREAESQYVPPVEDDDYPESPSGEYPAEDLEESVDNAAGKSGEKASLSLPEAKPSGKEEARRIKQEMKEQQRLARAAEREERKARKGRKASLEPPKAVAEAVPAERQKADPRANYKYTPSEPVDPYKPIAFPVYEDIPDFATIGKASRSYLGQEEREEEPDQGFDEPGPPEDPGEEVFKPSPSFRYSAGQTSFTKGGMIEAALENMARQEASGERSQVSRKPIIGYDDKRKAKEASDSPVAPSSLSPEHPRYKLFESLKDQPGVSHFPAKTFKAETPAKKDTYGSTYVREMLRDIEEHKAQEEEAVPEKKTARQHKAPAVMPDETPAPDEITPEPRKTVRKRPAAEPEPEREEEDYEEEAAVTDADFLLSVGIGGLQSNVSGFQGIMQRSKARYSAPSDRFLVEYPSLSTEIDEFTQAQGETIVETLHKFNTEVTLSGIVKGPTVTMYELKLKDGTPVTRVTQRYNEISYYLGGQQLRILAPIPGKQAVGVEVPNKTRATIGFKDMLQEYGKNQSFQKFKVPMILGRTITGEPRIIDVSKMPHMLIAGTTGSGKSVCINTFICTILYTKSPKEVRLMMVDPKVVELSLYNGIPHLLTPVITDAKKAVKALAWLVDEMDRRYQMLSRFGVRNIEGLNNKITNEKIPAERLPYIVLIMDEFADLMAVVKSDIETYVARLAAKARAAGIHLILATQRPSADVITGTIKNNFPGRIAFAVSSAVNSRIILDEGGAESLLGRGDMLILDPSSSGTVRIQGAFLSDEEVDAVAGFEKKHNSTDYLKDELFEDQEEQGEPEDGDAAADEDGDDALYERAKEICYERKQASASYLQRRMKIGYNRAARLIEMMEDEGIVGPPQGSKPREIINYK